MLSSKEVLKNALVNITGMFLTMPGVKALQKAEDGRSITLTMDGENGPHQIEAYPVGYSYFGLDDLGGVGEILTEIYGEDLELFRVYCGLYTIVSKEKTEGQRFSIWEIRDVIDAIKDDISIRVISKVLHSDFAESLEKVQLFITRLNLMGVLKCIEMVFPSSLAGDVVHSHGFNSRIFNVISHKAFNSEFNDSSKEKVFTDLLLKKPIIKVLNAFFLLSYIIDYTLDAEYLAKTRGVEVSRHDLTMVGNITTLWQDLVQSDHRLHSLWSRVKSDLDNGHPKNTIIEFKTFVEL